ncbi:hypothetical protein AhnVgp113 [Adoxophyes honmai nucleopolyhedrovirus]|uniref:Tetratricopeptide repeat protein n=1 Tax=Adoxophyes honmai nucleopolyhedrovirus TaxID=224399 RepID=Q80LI3_NPVAH|nr:hypothetical protein AhnVgp113 [Adoxophyes honmai nucleopolyhedrovirus]BAC67364.1 hypothetical protein [Adoxophyes honmai nucleopolyhedrovirus]
MNYVEEAIALAETFVRIGYYKRAIICYQLAINYYKGNDSTIKLKCYKRIIELQSLIESNTTKMTKIVLLSDATNST